MLSQHPQCMHKVGGKAVCLHHVRDGRTTTDRRTDGASLRLLASLRFFCRARGAPVTFSSVYDYSRGQTENTPLKMEKISALTFLQTSLSRPVSATAGRRPGDTVKAAQRHNLDKKKTTTTTTTSEQFSFSVQRNSPARDVKEVLSHNRAGTQVTD